jgi:hypothetical protein
MFAGTLPPVTNAADWIQSLEIRSTADNALVDLTGATIEVEIRDKAGCALLRGSTDDGIVSMPALGIVTWTFRVSSMRNLAPGLYCVFARITLGGDTTQLLALELPVHDGGFA